MLRVSSGQDYLLCNSDLKTPVGLHLNVTAKKCFEIHRLFVQLHDSVRHLSHHRLPEDGLHVEVEEEQQAEDGLHGEVDQEQQAGHDQSVEISKT